MKRLAFVCLFAFSLVRVQAQDVTLNREALNQAIDRATSYFQNLPVEELTSEQLVLLHEMQLKGMIQMDLPGWNELVKSRPDLSVAAPLFFKEEFNNPPKLTFENIDNWVKEPLASVYLQARFCDELGYNTRLLDQIKENSKVHGVFLSYSYLSLYYLIQNNCLPKSAQIREIESEMKDQLILMLINPDIAGCIPVQNLAHGIYTCFETQHEALVKAEDIQKLMDWQLGNGAWSNSDEHKNSDASTSVYGLYSLLLYRSLLNAQP